MPRKPRPIPSQPPERAAVGSAWRLYVVAGALLGLLAGCVQTAEQPAEQEEIPVADEGTPAQIVQLPRENFSPILYNGVAPVPIAPVNDDPDQLLGMTSDTLDEILGKPTLVRRDGGAEVWQYRAEACVLDLFLYGYMKQVEHVDLRDRGDSTDVMVRACFVQMLREDTPAS